MQAANGDVPGGTYSRSGMGLSGYPQTWDWLWHLDCHCLVGGPAGSTGICGGASWRREEILIKVHWKSQVNGVYGCNLRTFVLHVSRKKLEAIIENEDY